MLRKFKITIDGQEDLVEMEEIGGSTQPQPILAPSSQPTVPVQLVAENKQESEAAAPSQPVTADGEPMTAPMPGTILKILVNVGDQVMENQPLLLLEAMKMENEVVAAKAGQVTEIQATIGQVVNAGDPLLTIA